MKLTNILLLSYTLYYLKLKQIIFRIYYFIRDKLSKKHSFGEPKESFSLTSGIVFTTSIPSLLSYRKNEFIFLNIKFRFNNGIDWKFSKNGKLWTYNLTYFDYLNQKEMSKEDGLMLINDFIDKSYNIKDGFMPFPISLRGINWIKFLTNYKIENQKINDSLYTQYSILMDNIEYHILGNHLLENGFSLLFGAYYFRDETFYAKAKTILIEELDEQVLNDGAHFELSPMYHQIILLRILDSINLVKNNAWKNSELLELLEHKASLMLGWLNVITFEDGTIPLLNDSSNNIAPTTKELNFYGEQLNVMQTSVIIKECGYRKVKNEYYECIMDVGNIGPDYIPGHAHSDTFNFVLYLKGSPCIVDTGLSTYEANQRRMLERSTSSHNTVEVDGINQSEVWSGFRVARRAKIVSLKEKKNTIEAVHDGYKRIGALHKRKFTLNDRSIIIEDFIHGNSEHQAVAYLHFYPGIRPIIKDNVITIDQTEIILENANKIEIEEYQYAPEFNKLVDAQKAKISFQNNLKMEIKI